MGDEGGAGGRVDANGRARAKWTGGGRGELVGGGGTTSGGRWWAGVARGGRPWRRCGAAAPKWEGEVSSARLSTGTTRGDRRDGH